MNKLLSDRLRHYEEDEDYEGSVLGAAQLSPRIQSKLNSMLSSNFDTAAFLEEAGIDSVEAFGQSEEKSGTPVQAKSEISQPGDAGELQADRVGEAVARGDSQSSQLAMNEKVAAVAPKGGNGALSSNPEFDNQLKSSKGEGTELDNPIKKEMEGHLGADLSGVKIHTGDKANELSESINAKAFTHGNDVYFKDGNYNPASTEGKQLLAHELTHTQQQGGNVNVKIQRAPDDPPEVTGKEKQGDITPDAKYVFLEGGDRNKANGIHGKWVLAPRGGEVEKSFIKIKTMIAEAKKQGANQAAANLEYWLSGKGGTFNPTLSWLNTVSLFVDAKKENQDRFFNFPNSKNESINILAAKLKKGESIKFNDSWQKKIWAIAYHIPGMSINPNVDFAFAYGTATLKSTGNFNLTKHSNKVDVNGIITHNFIDKYDWELGLSVTIAGETVTDEELKLMEIYKSAKAFDVNYIFVENVNTSIK